MSLLKLLQVFFLSYFHFGVYELHNPTGKLIVSIVEVFFSVPRKSDSFHGPIAKNGLKITPLPKYGTTDKMVHKMFEKNYPFKVKRWTFLLTTFVGSFAFF